MGHSSSETSTRGRLARGQRSHYSLLCYLPIDEAASLQNHGAVIQSHHQGVGEGDVDVQGFAHLGSFKYLCGEKREVP